MPGNCEVAAGRPLYVATPGCLQPAVFIASRSPASSDSLLDAGGNDTLLERSGASWGSESTYGTPAVCSTGSICAVLSLNGTSTAVTRPETRLPAQLAAVFGSPRSSRTSSTTLW